MDGLSKPEPPKYRDTPTWTVTPEHQHGNQICAKQCGVQWASRAKSGVNKGESATKASSTGLALWKISSQLQAYLWAA